MLTKLTIENYKCFKHAEVTIPANGLVVLMGVNAAGKSTVLEALDLLSHAVRDPSGLLDAANVRGGLTSVTRWGASRPIRLTAEFKGGPFTIDKGDVRYELELTDIGGRPVVASETLTVRKPHYSQPMPVLRARGKVRELFNIVTQAWDAAGGIPEQPIASTVSQEAPYPTPLHLREALSSARVYGSFITAPGWLQLAHERSEGPMALQIAQPVPRIGARGIDLVNALRTIREHQPARWDRLVTDFQAEFPFVRDISFPPLPAGRQALAWKHPQAPRDLYLEQFSEGMIAYISILAAAHAEDAPAWIAFDEPEVHLHPSLLRRTIAVLEARAERSPIIVATHSDAILDFLSDPMDALHLVNGSADGSTISKPDADGLADWMSSYRLSELRRRGYLEQRGLTE